jgi:glutathione synthase/RimK-type ligase-like ATP-grasp enzyme
MNYILRRRKLGNGSSLGIKAKSQQGIEVFRNDKQLPADAGYVFRWGCTSDIPGNNRVIVNEAKAIHWCADKRKGRMEMQAAGVPVPETETDYLKVVEWNSKVVVRPSRHAQGKHLYVYDLTQGRVADYEAMSNKCRELRDYYISELINKVAEYRVFCIQNRVAWVAKKTPGNPDQVAWNVAQGGRFDNVRWDEWPKPVVQAALAAAKVSGCDFCGVDVMVDAEGKPYVLEVNSAPSQTSDYRQQCVAKAFDYIILNGKKPFPDVKDSPRRTYRSYIHPGVCDRAVANGD